MSKPSHSAGRLAASLLLAAGLLSILNNYLPGSEHLDRAALNLVGALAIVSAAATWFAPWGRTHPRATLVLVPVALTLIAAANQFGGVSPYSYAVYFVVLFIWIGIAHPPKTSFVAAPLATAAYVLPAMTTAEPLPAGAVSSVTVAIPVCVLVAETVSRVVARLDRTSREASARAALLGHLASATRRMSETDPERVLESMVDAAIALGFEAAEICEFDRATRTYAVRYTQGLPTDYAAARHPAGVGVAGRVLERRATVVVGDYEALPDAVPPLRDQGFKAVIGAPIWVDGDVAAALIAGTRRRNDLGADEVEAVNLLAGQAGRALEIARRVESERRAVEHLAELDRLKDDFVSTASHELRTPLTVIAGIGATLEQRWDVLPEAERRDMIAMLNSNSKRLIGIIETLLDFSRLDSGAQPDRRPVDLAQLVGSLLDRLGRLFEAHPLTVDVPANLGVWADRDMLERVIENLMVNAVNHTPSGTQVRVTAAVSANGVLVAVSDDGPGIPLEDLPHIGRRFFRAGPRNTRASKGTGLGLAMAREILLLHGSTLEIDSLPGHGASFSFRMKAAEPIELVHEERRGA